MTGFNALVGFSVASLASPLVSFAKDKEKVWSKVDLQIKDTLFDISFDPSKPAHGWLVGAKVCCQFNYAPYLQYSFFVYLRELFLKLSTVAKLGPHVHLQLSMKTKK